MKAKLKFLRIADDDNEPVLIIRDMTDEESLPYLFRVGDQVEIGDDGDIGTVRRADIHNIGSVMSIEWLERRLMELHWKIQNSLNNDSFVSQADVYERNYLMEISNMMKKEKADAENS